MTTSDDLHALVETMSGFPCPWFICGGWAIQLFAPNAPREHEHLKLGIFRDDQAALHSHLADWSLEKVTATDRGSRWAEWRAGQRLLLPTHQVRAQHPSLPPKEFEVFLNESTPGLFHSRRHAGLTRPLEFVIFYSLEGIPYLAPEIQLLFKAKYHREKDEHDFHATLPLLAPGQKTWLQDALQKYHATDAWTDQL